MSSPSPSTPTHTTLSWGLPSGLRVTRWARFPALSAARAASLSTRSTLARRSAVTWRGAGLRRFDHHRAGAQASAPAGGGADRDGHLLRAGLLLADRQPARPPPHGI